MKGNLKELALQLKCNSSLAVHLQRCQQHHGSIIERNFLFLAQVSFPGVSVADQERANVRPPNPSLCVGNGFVIEITDLVCDSFSCQTCLNHLHIYCAAAHSLRSCTTVQTLKERMVPAQHLSALQMNAELFQGKWGKQIFT